MCQIMDSKGLCDGGMNSAGNSTLKAVAYGTGCIALS